MLWMILKPLFYLPPLIYSPIFSTLFFAPWGRTTWTTLTGLLSIRAPTRVRPRYLFPRKVSCKVDCLSQTTITAPLKTADYKILSFLLSSGIYSFPFMSSCLWMVLTCLQYPQVVPWSLMLHPHTHIFVNYTFVNKVYSNYPTLCVPSVSGCDWVCSLKSTWENKLISIY